MSNNNDPKEQPMSDEPDRMDRPNQEAVREPDAPPEVVHETERETETETVTETDTETVTEEESPE